MPSIYESDDKDDKDDKSKIPIEKLVLVFHDPKRVIKLQSEMFPFCFGYLIFPKLAIQPSLAIQDQTINQVCTSILRSIEKRIPQIKEVSDNADLKKTIEFMLKTSNPSNLSVRFVSADKVQHFQVPSLKYYPYGESIFDSCKFSAKVLIALETALTIHRLNRSTEKRKVSIEVGLPRDAKKLIENIKEELRKRKVSIDTFGTVDTIACFSLDTKIRLTYGYSMSLGDIIKQFENGKYMEVYSYDHKTGKLCPDKIVNAKITGRDVEVVKVTLDNNKSELCTPDHLWMLRDGSYKEAKDLKEGDSLMPFYRKSSSLNAKGLKYEVLYHPHNRWELTHRAFGKYLGMVEDISYKAIHHKDKNPQNNCTLNLEGLTRSQHAKIHSKDLDGGFNGSSIGNEVPIIKSNCVICGKLIITPYNHKGIVCSKECLEIYRKDYSLNSWISRKDKNEYELYNVKCSNCGKELKISKSKYISRKHDLFSCDNEICKKRLDYLARVYARNPNGYIEIEYKNCLACGKLFVLKKGSGRILCSRKCTTSYASNNRVTKIETKCDNCGKKIFILDRLFNIENRFNYCEDKKCTENISRLNTSISKNGGKSYSNVEFGKCIICGIPTSFSNKKPGYKYRTCGSKSCSSKVMHRSTNYINNVEHAVLNHKVKSVELIETRIDVGDIQTEKFHNFALDSGVIVHNSSITSFEDVYIPMKDGKPFVDISTFNDGGVDVRGKVDELKLLRDQLISSLGVPPAFIGIEEGQSWKTTLSEENMLFARTIIAHQKYLSEQINDLIQKIYNITDPEESLTILDNVQISFMAPKSLQFEREARYMGELANLVRTLEEVGVPKEYSKKKYLHGIDWEEIENYEIDSTIDKKIGTKKDESGGMGGMGMGGMGGGF